MYVLYSYLFYALLSIAATIWVGQTLFKNGRIFLVDAMQGNEPLSDSINHLLLVGFYLVNIGYVALALRYGEHPDSAVSAVESVSTKIGMVLMLLGAMHFFNLYALSKFRSWGRSLHGPKNPVRGEAAAS